MKPHPNSPLRHRKPASPPKPFSASPETEIPASPAPGERERGAALSHPVTRGGVGERSAPRPRRRKRNPHPNSPLRRRKPASPPKPLPASSEMKPHPNSPLRRRKPESPPKAFPESSETEIPAEPAPGERERVATLSHPVTRGGVWEQSAPRPRRRKRNPHPNSPSRRRKPEAPPKAFPESSETQIPAEPAPGEHERVATLSHPVTQGGVGERSAPRPRRRKRNPHPNISLRRRKPASPPKHFPASSEIQIPVRTARESARGS